MRCYILLNSQICYTNIGIPKSSTREIRHFSSLRHPSIVKLKEVVIDPRKNNQFLSLQPARTPKSYQIISISSSIMLTMTQLESYVPLTKVFYHRTCDQLGLSIEYLLKCSNLTYFKLFMYSIFFMAIVLFIVILNQTISSSLMTTRCSYAILDYPVRYFLLPVN